MTFDTLIWNDLCQTLFLYFYSIFLFLTLNARAASTMNQSDIRGLAFRPEPTVIFSVASFAFYGREFGSSKMNLSHRVAASSFVVPALLSINYSLIKSYKQLRWRADEKKSQAASFAFFLAWYCVTANHIKPANSLAIAIFALHGILPLLIRCRCRLVNLRPAASAISMAHCGCPFLRFLSTFDGTYLCR